MTSVAIKNQKPVYPLQV
ncbi:hypothetical protein PENSOL_c005G00015 [Penicillium solitum]|uniref:Uncharacterized protein n=1 Tax=Penicillium solitum TaxID=60172 RepID=A0A1V6Q3R5_9EURO|nr:hypothetical protein PENSOL_c138G08435 [Penicillium solitum]OQE01082.1 hypothetical protein PENSOL_c005G00015 [Penicillium solitum]